LNISYKTTQTKCCGTITEITNFRYNNAVDIPGGQGNTRIKKVATPLVTFVYHS